MHALNWKSLKRNNKEININCKRNKHTHTHSQVEWKLTKWYEISELCYEHWANLWIAPSTNPMLRRRVVHVHLNRFRTYVGDPCAIVSSPSQLSRLNGNVEMKIVKHLQHIMYSWAFCVDNLCRINVWRIVYAMAKQLYMKSLKWAQKI